jgi:hypothetical protein
MGYVFAHAAFAVEVEVTKNELCLSYPVVGRFLEQIHGAFVVLLDSLASDVAES